METTVADWGDVEETAQLSENISVCYLGLESFVIPLTIYNPTIFTPLLSPYVKQTILCNDQEDNTNTGIAEEIR